MPVKNLERYLEECLSSILSQTYRHWELIVVDDHSSDNSRDIINAFAAKDDRIQRFQNQGSGIVPALELALTKVNGAYITRFDGDDLMPTERLSQMASALDGTAPKTVVTGKVRYFSEKPVSPGYTSYEYWLNQRVDKNDHWQWIYRECVIASPNWMTRTRDLKAMGGFKEMNYPEDYHLVLKWYESGFHVKPIQEVTLQWREHPERTSRNSKHYNQEHFFRLKVRYFVQHQLRGAQLVLWGCEVKGKLTARILSETGTDFQWMDLAESGSRKAISGQEIRNYRDIERLKNYKLLLSVYPAEKQRHGIDNYLHNLGLQLGRDYWYL